MPRVYSTDMRERVIARVESGASRREAAEHYEVSPEHGGDLGEVLSRDRPVQRQAGLVGASRHWRSTRSFCWRSSMSSQT
jgi:hypothetical protein